MAVAVPIVSKKSVSIRLKIVRIAPSTPSVPKTLVRSNWPSVEKFGAWKRFAGTVVTPTMNAMIEVMTMLMTSAAGTLRT